MLEIDYMGYSVCQADNNHITVSKDGKRVAHASCSVTHTEESLRESAEFLLAVAGRVPAPKPNIPTPKAAAFPSEKVVNHLRAEYPKGTRVYLLSMIDPHDPVPSGTRGTVEKVDDAGQLQMAWDNGRTLALIPNADEFRKLTAGEAQLEEELEIFCVEMMQELTAPGDNQPFYISDKDEYLTVRLDESPEGKLFFTVSFSPEGVPFVNHDNHTAKADHHADKLLHACRRVLSLYGK